MYKATHENRESLHRRSRWRKNLEAMEIEMGLRAPYCQDTLDYSLFREVMENNSWGMREMVALGADPNMALKPASGDTLCRLLHIATIASNLPTISLLLQLGANPLATDSHGLTARDYALKHDRTGRIATLLRSWEQKRTNPVNDDLPPVALEIREDASY